jgi:hypothetical protein
MLVLAPLKLICASGSSGSPIRAIAIEILLIKIHNQKLSGGMLQFILQAGFFSSIATIPLCARRTKGGAKFSHYTNK